jgi:acyl carrier protein
MAKITTDQALARLQEIFRKEFARDDILLTPNTTADDIRGWDSHKHIEIILACEDAFGVRLKPREINALKSVGEMAEHLAKMAAR